jgi:CheY-like chemotaxis protein
MHDQAVLVVDPDAEARAETVETLSAAGLTVETADSLAAAQTRLEADPVEAVVTRYRLGDGTGLDLAAWVRERTPDTGCVLYAATADIDTADFEATVVDFVPREVPDAADQLLAVVEGATETVSQAAYPLPEDEPGRLEAVATYTGGAESVSGPLERVTELAAEHFGVEVASVNVVAEHEQRFLAVHGRRWPPTTRDESICTYTILEERTMAVPDTAEDARFADNENVRSAGIRAYLGATLRTPDGHNIGSLCVYDDQPRYFDDDEEAYLVTLADLAMDVLALGGGPS